jgi:hypothetical protein
MEPDKQSTVYTQRQVKEFLDIYGELARKSYLFSYVERGKDERLLNSVTVGELERSIEDADKIPEELRDPNFSPILTTVKRLLDKLKTL